MRQSESSSLDHAILAFGRSWYGYGGGSDEDIYVEFGIPARTYFERLQAVIDSPAARDIDGAVRDAIKSVCRNRLEHAAD